MGMAGQQGISYDTWQAPIDTRPVGCFRGVFVHLYAKRTSEKSDSLLIRLGGKKMKQELIHWFQSVMFVSTFQISFPLLFHQFSFPV